MAERRAREIDIERGVLQERLNATLVELKDVKYTMESMRVELESLQQAKEQLTREPMPLPTLNINTEFWSTESGECGIGPIDAIAVFNAFNDNNFCRCLLEEDLQLSNYQSHPAIKAPLSN
jgi:thymidylate synthase